MIGNRICKLEKFFKVSKPKDINVVEWSEQLHEMVLDWEEEHQESFPF